MFDIISKEILKSSNEVLLAYLWGVAHDGSYNIKHKTYRFVQKEREFLELIKIILDKLGKKSWLYKEGSKRELYCLETTGSFGKYGDSYAWMNLESQKAFIRGYFDAEGGVPKNIASRFYIQICQKNKCELEYIKNILEVLNILSGEIHNPSINVDPYYFRFYISARSYNEFIKLIGSWHPRKRQILHDNYVSAYQEMSPNV